ncbi:MAG TPA: hypothetical protein VLH40_06865 [Atribacteraceae bacterium]|nr:hypothetical protein [Atribacteraceae bacterium]
MRDKTIKLIEAAAEVLREHNPMTLRQVYYQLVAKHVIDNNRAEYQRLSGALVKARQDELIPWDWIEDRGRLPRTVNMWCDLSDFMNTVRHAYRKDIWESQPQYVEVWLEKDALSGIFSDITGEYGVTLAVGRGYNSWSAYHDAAERFNGHKEQGRDGVILYFGDFDPSGEDIFRAIGDSLDFFGTCPTIEKVALTMQDVRDHNLPPDFTKTTDSRSKAHVAKHGDIAVELDALPLPVLQEKIREAIEGSLDKSRFVAAREIERQETLQLADLIEGRRKK